MKKLVFVAIATMISLTAVQAQSIQFGAKAGVNLANLTGDVEGATIRTSFHVGGVAEFKISDMFAFQPELLYSSQGTKQEYLGDTGMISVTSKLDYLNIPLTAKIYLTEWLSIQAAPQIGMLVAAVQESDNEGVAIEDYKELLKGIDFSFNIGAGYKLPSGLFFDARYNLGLANLNDISEDDSTFKNGVLQIAVGYWF